MIEIRAHEIDEMQRWLDGYPSDILETHGQEVIDNAKTVVTEIKNNHNVLVSITDKFGSICDPRCIFRKNASHHCKGILILIYEAQEARKHGLRIGDKKPANQIFDI